MNFETAFNTLQELIKETICEMNLAKFNNEEMNTFTNEIIAYLFVIQYGKNENENTTKYTKEYTVEQCLSSDGDDISNDYNEENLKKRVQRRTRIHLNARTQHWKKLISMNVKVPDYMLKKLYHLDKTNGTNATKKFDKANMIFLNKIATPEREVQCNHSKKKETLLNLMQHDISNPDKVPVPKLVDAYKQIDEMYKEAQKISPYANRKDKEDYIAYWVNFYRMEKSLYPSFINDMADYMIEHGISEIPLTQKHIDYLYRPMCLSFGDKSVLLDTFSILNFRQNICYCFSKDNVDAFANSFFESRMNQKFLIFNIAEKTEKLFKIQGTNGKEEILSKYFEEYFNNLDSYSIEIMYKFCRNSYPIIESHKPFVFTKEGDAEKISYKKVKYIREITKKLIPHEELKEYYNI